jgi:predicted O-methyltransferase YrrM
MSRETWSAVDGYINELLVQQDAALETALARSAAEQLPEIAVTASQGKLLMMLATMMQARNILEIGTLGGYSTIWLARALPAGGRLVTLEIDEKHAKIARENIEGAALGHLVEIKLAPAVESLSSLVAEGREPFDFIFIDADKPACPEYFEWSMRLARPGTVIIIDNVVRNGALVDAASTNPDVQGVRKLCELLAANSNVTCTALQTIGSKGYDGFAMAIVNKAIVNKMA